MTVTNNPKNSGASFTLDMGQDSATGNQVAKVVIAEPAGGTFVTPALETGNLASIKTNTATTSAGTPATAGLPIQGMTGGVPVPVTGTFWQTTQPVSGTFWQTTQPVSLASMPSTPVTGTFWQATQPVSGTFWQATQPVSAASLPLPAGAATSANQNVTAAGASASNAQAIQGVTGGVAIPISGTVSASFSGFTPTPAYAAITAATTTSNVALPSGTTVVVYNNGTVPAFIKFGTSNAVVATVADDVLQPASWLSFSVGSFTWLSAITASGSAALTLSGGAGLPTGAGGGGGGASGAVTANAGTNLNTSLLALETGGNLASIKTNTAITAAGTTAASGSPVQGMTGGVPLPVSGTFFQATQPVSAASLPLPTGAATVAKQPALGTAGTASADVITVQGVASMTPVKTDGSGVTQPISAASLPLPAGAATAVGLTAINTTLGTPMQATGGVVTANAGTNLNTSALALETGGNLASIKTNTAITAAGTTAASGSPVQGMTGGVPLPVSVASLPLPSGAAADGTDGTGIVQPTGGVGIRGWLSGIYSKLVSPVLPSNAAQETGGNLAAILTAAMGSIPAGSAIIGKVGIDQTTPGTTNAVVATANAGTNLNTSALALEAGGNLAAVLATRTITPAATVSIAGNTAIAAHISPVAGQYSYLTSIFISGLGATAASAILCNITGILGGTINFWINIPAGVTTAITPFIIKFSPGFISSAVNTTIQCNVPAFGAGNTQAMVSVQGFTSVSNSIIS